MDPIQSLSPGSGLLYLYLWYSSFHLALLYEGDEVVPHAVDQQGGDQDTPVEPRVTLRPYLHNKNHIKCKNLYFD